jgi:hypothetical protein
MSNPAIPEPDATPLSQVLGIIVNGLCTVGWYSPPPQRPTAQYVDVMALALLPVIAVSSLPAIVASRPGSAPQWPGPPGVSG